MLEQRFKIKAKYQEQKIFNKWSVQQSKGSTGMALERLVELF